MEVSDAARLYVSRRWGVEPLYSSFTHLVSRTPVPGLNSSRPLEFSHPIHVDNCRLFNNGTCWPGGGAFIHRHFSAILYLNSDFDGGEFVFADIVSRKPTVRVQPRCGRLVAFSAGPENPHGVLAVRRGTRRALAMWFTRTGRQREEERLLADIYLRDSSALEVRRMVSLLERNFERADKLV
ncbi:Prolyl 3-hydroxylase 2 [Amphibalanus amphitrite]|uniref:procollagen-proline 3-dioxygenase n=2 Tax=Amphibalanus amphitrite TaxID=1232801 RepID=A0A6A4WJV8_AMPAM|nr:Prolyl 3-hydroxylase 2 [Amphibalanus amphitrite]